MCKYCSSNFSAIYAVGLYDGTFLLILDEGLSHQFCLSCIFLESLF